ncbi:MULTISPECIES: phosphoglycolate phosphatase [Luteimonas]|uniref:phosphoglycolate phosphatase n=1 Tax=Luteimonas TaxID=83614 RepID=UPI000C7D7907|nr:MULTISPECIES: phosphoglycolate phosphatase [Luteimonas]
MPIASSAADYPWPVVLFDLDGTLVDSAADIAEAVNRMLAELDLARVDEATVRSWIGDGAGQLITQALQHAGSSLTSDAVMPRFMVHYADCLLLAPQLYPGVAETLQALQARGVRMAVCTNKPERFVAPLLAAMGIAGRFEAVVGAGTVAERKPHPLPLTHLAAHFHVPVSRCLMVGDSATDAGAANAAGAPLVLVSYGYRRSFDLHGCGALAVIDRFDDLLALA